MSSELPNLLWITIDSVRADHTSLHGYERDTTPELSQIASAPDGENFEHGISHSTRTPISVPSMLTGLYPSRHRMIGKMVNHQLPPSIKTAPELLAESGYRTIGVSENGFAGAAKGIDERFEDFTKSSPSNLREVLTGELGRSFIKYVFNTRAHGPGLTLDIHAHGKQSSFFTLDILKRKLGRLSESAQPFFCYAHFNDTHHPYIPPKSYRNEYIDEIDATVDDAVEFALRMSDSRWEWMAHGLPLSEEEWKMLFAMYDATVKYVDSCVGRLFKFVRDQLTDTILVITSDHGELFGEYGLLDHHSVLHDGLIHVPLVTYGLDDVSSHTDKPTQHIDVMQTLMSLVGADTSQFQGYNLRDETREVALSQALHESVDDDERVNYDRILQHSSEIDLSHLPQSLATAARTTDFKLVKTAEWRKLYHLPDEINDAKRDNPSVYGELSTFLDNWIENESKPLDEAPKKSQLSVEMEQHLRELGYL